MKIRIIGIVLVVVILGVLAYLIEDSSPITPKVAPQSNSDTAFKDLKIN